MDEYDVESNPRERVRIETMRRAKRAMNDKSFRLGRRLRAGRSLSRSLNWSGIGTGIAVEMNAAL